MTKLPPPPPPGSTQAYWLCQLGGWYGYATVMTLVIIVLHARPFGLAALEGLEVPPMPRAGFELFGIGTIGIALSHAFRAYARPRRWDTLSLWPLIARILIAGFVLGSLLAIPQQFMTVRWLQTLPAGTPLALAVLQLVINWAALFWIWIGIYFVALESRKRRYAELRQSELARELQGAQLRLLKAQVNPHFLFNSLNSVRALISEDTAAATRAVTQLARTLRYSLASGDPPELVTLEQELETVADYLELEGLRLGERLRIERDVDADALRTRVPVMLVQTLVENAIKHGLAELPEGGTLRISARQRDGTLRLEIENPRPRNVEPRKGEGIGLRNGAERLRLLFGDDASLDLDLSGPDRAIARLRVPVGR